jgi:murein L,D-transpeptidase YcbB/YkuD
MTGGRQDSAVNEILGNLVLARRLAGFRPGGSGWHETANRVRLMAKRTTKHEAAVQNHLLKSAAAWVLLAGIAAAPALAQEAVPSDSAGAVTATTLPAPPAPEPVLAPAEAAFRAGLVRALEGGPEAEREAILGFYAARDYRPFWTEAGSGADRRDELVAALSEAPAHGLPLRRNDPGAMSTLFALAGDPAEVPLIEATASRTFLRHARILAGGILTPSSIDADITLQPARPDRSALMADLQAGTPVEAILDAQLPEGTEYAALMAEKARLEVMIASGGWGDTVPTGPTLREGDSDPRIADLRGRLERLGYGPLGVSEFFDRPLHDAVMALQSDKGLVQDGAVGPATLAAINAPVESRLRQVVVNLERMRWMDRDLGARHIYVNIPDYTVRVVEDGATVFESRVVVGKNETRTPEFSDRMTHLVVNPTWYIPDSIAKRVYLPQLRGDPNVLSRNNMRIFTRSGTEINPALVDFSQLESGSFPFRIRQNPSPANALGQVKFMFPNQFSIYLHDTPAKELFDRDARSFSNGCVRVEKAFELAHYLLAPQLEDPQATFRSWVDAGSERYVNLDQPIAVHLVYRTVWLDEAGEVRYRGDIYGRDRAVFEALEAEGVTLPAAQG